jgi:hypothetical protein
MLLDKHGAVLQAEVRTRDLFVDNGFYAREILAHWPQQLGPPADSLSDTRLARQAGGSIRSVSRWVATIAAVPYAVPMGDKWHFDPPVAIGEKLIAINNILGYPGTQIFPFFHTPEATVDFELEYLWPSPEVDWVYKRLVELATEFCSEYLRKEGVAANDFLNGVIDPGYMAADPQEGRSLAT